MLTWRWQGYFHSLAAEVFGDNVHVTVALPGPVLSNALSAAFTDTVGQVRRLPLNHTQMVVKVSAMRGVLLMDWLRGFPSACGSLLLRFSFLSLHVVSPILVMAQRGKLSWLYSSTINTSYRIVVWLAPAVILLCCYLCKSQHCC